MNKTFRVSLPDGAYYDANDNENLLAAAQRAHWLVRYGCRNGNCDACAADLLQGCVQHRDGAIPKEKSAEEKSVEEKYAEHGTKILLCLCRPLSDLNIALPNDPRPGSLDQSLRSYVHLQQQTISESESILFFSLPAGRRPALLADQIALIETDAGLLQGHIDYERSKERELIVKLIFASPLQEGAYYHVRYPLSTIYMQESHNG